MAVAVSVDRITTRPAERTDQWLYEALESIWSHHFPDVPRLNPVDISYARPWKRRLGLITLTESSRTSLIRLNRLLAHPGVPDCVNLVTIAHELVHYTHGFGSTLPRRYRHPHQGGIVKRELLQRGLADLHQRYARWIDEHWFPFYHTQVASRERGRTARR